MTTETENQYWIPSKLFESCVVAIPYVVKLRVAISRCDGVVRAFSHECDFSKMSMKELEDDDRD